MKIFGGKLRLRDHTMERHGRAIDLCELAANASTKRDQDAYLKELIRTLADSLRPFGIIILRFRIPIPFTKRAIQYSIDERYIDEMLREVKIIDDKREVKIKAPDVKGKFIQMVSTIAARMNKTSRELMANSTTEEFERDAIEVLRRDSSFVSDMVMAYHQPVEKMKEVNASMRDLAQARKKINQKFDGEKKKLGKPAGVLKKGQFGSLQRQPV